MSGWFREGEAVEESFNARGVCVCVQVAMAVTGAMVTRCAFLLPQCMGGSTVVRGSGRQTMAFSSSSIPTLSLRAAPLRHSFMPSSTRNFHSCRVVFSKCVTREEGEIDSATYRVFLSDETGRPVSIGLPFFYQHLLLVVPVLREGVHLAHLITDIY